MPLVKLVETLHKLSRVHSSQSKYAATNKGIADLAVVKLWTPSFVEYFNFPPLSYHHLI